MSSTIDVSTNTVENREEESKKSNNLSVPTWNKLSKLTKKNKLYDYAEK